MSTTTPKTVSVDFTAPTGAPEGANMELALRRRTPTGLEKLPSVKDNSPEDTDARRGVISPRLEAGHTYVVQFNHDTSLKGGDTNTFYEVKVDEDGKVSKVPMSPPLAVDTRHGMKKGATITVKDSDGKVITKFRDNGPNDLDQSHNVKAATVTIPQGTSGTVEISNPGSDAPIILTFTEWGPGVELTRMAAPEGKPSTAQQQYDQDAKVVLEAEEEIRNNRAEDDKKIKDRHDELHKRRAEIVAYLAPKGIDPEKDSRDKEGLSDNDRNLIDEYHAKGRELQDPRGQTRGQIRDRQGAIQTRRAEIESYLKQKYPDKADPINAPEVIEKEKALIDEFHALGREWNALGTILDPGGDLNAVTSQEMAGLLSGSDQEGTRAHRLQGALERLGAPNYGNLDYAESSKLPELQGAGGAGAKQRITQMTEAGKGADKALEDAADQIAAKLQEIQLKADIYARTQGPTIATMADVTTVNGMNSDAVMQAYGHVADVAEAIGELMKLIESFKGDKSQLNMRVLDKSPAAALDKLKAFGVGGEDKSVLEYATDAFKGLLTAATNLNKRATAGLLNSVELKKAEDAQKRIQSIITIVSSVVGGVAAFGAIGMNTAFVGITRGALARTNDQLARKRDELGAIPAGARTQAQQDRASALPTEIADLTATAAEQSRTLVILGGFIGSDMLTSIPMQIARPAVLTGPATQPTSFADLGDEEKIVKGAVEARDKLVKQYPSLLSNTGYADNVPPEVRAKFEELEKQISEGGAWLAQERRNLIVSGLQGPTAEYNRSLDVFTAISARAGTPYKVEMGSVYDRKRSDAGHKNGVNKDGYMDGNNPKYDKDMKMFPMDSVTDHPEGLDTSRFVGFTEEEIQGPRYEGDIPSERIVRRMYWPRPGA